MADSKLNDLTEATSLGTADILYVVTDPAGTPGDKKISLTNLRSNIAAVDSMNIQVFTTTGTWTKPTGLKFAVVEVIGGGAGGGGTTGAVGQTANSGGGGGGGYSLKKIVESSLGATETVTIGAGGAGGTGNNAGTNGGTSSFGSHCSATGGTGGTGNGASASVPRRGLTCGAGGTGTGGDVNASGQAGPNGFNLALAAFGQVSGGGGASMYGAGGAQQTSVNTTGNAGIGYGAGGGGCAAYDVASSYTGGAGTDGIVVVYEYMEA